jgi:hypothetical protein
MMATRRKIHIEGAKRKPCDCSSVFDAFASGTTFWTGAGSYPRSKRSAPK